MPTVLKTRKYRILHGTFTNSGRIYGPPRATGARDGDIIFSTSDLMKFNGTGSPKFEELEMSEKDRVDHPDHHEGASTRPDGSRIHDTRLQLTREQLGTLTDAEIAAIVSDRGIDARGMTREETIERLAQRPKLTRSQLSELSDRELEEYSVERGVSLSGVTSRDEAIQKLLQ